MAEPLKNMYNPAFFDRLCPVLQRVIPGFDERRFIYRVFDKHWADLELKQRTHQITVALHAFLPPEFPKAVKLIVEISNTLRQQEREQSYPFIFLPEYLELYGQDHPELSLQAMEQNTQLVSAEFAIRPFIIKYPTQTLQYMLRWTQHPAASVRRLASEGCRPRLPWGIALPAFKKDPSPILPILENLKSDSSEYVRRSVANNLNDIAKDNPAIVLQIARQWQGGSEGTAWILKHGCRTLLKKGDEAVLGLHGFDPQIKADITGLAVQPKVAKGEYLPFEFTFKSQEKKTKMFRLEYTIDYVTSTGKTSRKIFRIAEFEAAPGMTRHIQRKQSFKDLTTRKHFAGKHALSIVVNGKVKASAVFVVK